MPMSEWSREVSREEGGAGAGIGRLVFVGGCWNGGMWVLNERD
jgi:hypothetical protein